MKQLANLFILAFIVSPFLNAQNISVDKSIEAKEKVVINTVSGNCFIKTSESEDIQISLEASYKQDCFTYEIESKEDKIKITEEFQGNCDGYSNWTITVPSDTEIEFGTASGNFEIAGISNEIKVGTASGKVTITDASDEVNAGTASGEIIITKASDDINAGTASGKISLSDISGEINAGTASGNIEIKNTSDEVNAGTASGNILIEGAVDKISAGTASGDIKITKATDEITAGAASGNVTLVLEQTPEKDISISSASGTAILDCNGKDIKGRYIFEAKKGKGTIISPYPFDEETTFEKEGKTYNRKSFTVGSDQPVIKIKTDSGTAKLKK